MLLGRPFMSIPLLLWHIPYGMAAAAVAFAAFFAVLINGRWPGGMWRFMERFFRFQCRSSAYLLLLNDMYPPFSGRKDARYAVAVKVDEPPRMDRLQVLFRCILLLPQAVPGVAFTLLAGAALLPASLAVLVAGHIPDPFWRVLDRYLVWTSRTKAYAMCLVDEYPPFHGRQTKAAVADAEAA
jgi:hypothetical protein